MRRQYKLVFSILALCLLLLGASGCIKEKEPKVNINTSALMYMEEKYGEPFAYVGPWGDSLSGTHKLFVSCNSLPGKNILVEIENYRKDNKVFRDNLLVVKYQENIQPYFERYIAAEFDESVVFAAASTTGLSEELAPDATFEQFLMDSRAFFVVGTAVSTDSFVSRDQAKNLAQRLADTGVQFRLTILVVDDVEYGTLSEEEFYDCRAWNRFVHCVEFTNSGGELVENYKDDGDGGVTGYDGW